MRVFLTIILTCITFFASYGYSMETSDEISNALKTLDLSIVPENENDLIKAQHKAKKKPGANEATVLNAFTKISKYIGQLNSDPMDSASKIIDHLFLGPHTVARNKAELNRLNIQSIIPMTAECGGIFANDGDFDYLDLANGLIEHKCTIQDILAIIDDVYDFASCALDQDRNIFIHCVRGKTRSASAVVYIIAKRQNQGIRKTYNFVKTKRDIQIPEEWLTALQQHLDDHS